MTGHCCLIFREKIDEVTEGDRTMSEEDKTVPPLRFPDFVGGEVDWKPLGDEKYFEIANTERKPVRRSLRTSGEIPYYGANNIQDYVEGYTHDGEYVLIAEDGSKSLEEYSIQYATGKLWANNHVHVVCGKYPLNTIFLYYYLSTVNFIPFLTNSGRAKLTKESMVQIPIPIPCSENSKKSLEIQNKISDCLSSIDDVIELEKQRLKALRDHKKGLLQKFFCKSYFDDSVFKEIQDIFDLRNGYTPSKMNRSFWDNGTVPWFRIDDIRKNGRILNQSLKYVSESALKSGKAFPANSLLVSTTATIGEYALITVEHLSNQQFVSLSPKSEYVDQINMKFMLYACFSLGEWCRRNTQPSNFASVEMDGFKKFRFPLPPLLLQEEIVQGLSAVDDVITTQEKKLEALHDHKKGLLQQLFPNIETLSE